MGKLWVWSPPHLIGTLEETADGDLSFTYSLTWLTRKEGRFSLSNSLKLDETRYLQEATAFFGNLLPEGGARDSLCRKLGISVDNDFELLRRIGRDCAGALVLSDSKDPPIEAGSLEEIPITVLAKWLKDDSSGLLDMQVKGDLRLSLAGAQDKLPLVYQNRRFYKPIGSQPTTHILKPAPKKFKYLPENEWIQSQIADSFGLPTAKSELVTIGKKRVLVVERYDRIQESGHWSRLHQEDFCQALAVPFKKKYESEGGPSFTQCLKIIDERSADSLSDTHSLLRWQILNILIGNCDGHAKNLSLLRHADGSWKLAPFYDLVATRIYPKLTHKLAMSIGGQFDSGTIQANHWRTLFHECRVSPSSYLKTTQEMAEQLMEHTEKVLNRFRELYGQSPVLVPIEQNHHRLSRRILRLLKNSRPDA